MMGSIQRRQQVGRTWMPTTAGILNIISGVFVLIGGIAVATMDTTMVTAIISYYSYSVGPGVPLTPLVITIFIVGLAAGLIISGIISISGGICALRRRLWGLALTGAIFTFSYLPPTGIPAIVFTALSKKEFR